ncbi:phosphoribosyl-ATP diphosphatase [Clavibacter tessellarius]|uniref:phosphoribosyl-ATP diphosphatase n=1 Tax=Clavibacter tessellarius TaxID=31965 RepID=UPI003249241E
MKTFDDLFGEPHPHRRRGGPRGPAPSASLDGGVHAIGKKVVEEAAEVWMAAEHESDDRAAEEISQLLYHVQVMMIARGLTLEDVGRHL